MPLIIDDSNWKTQVGNGKAVYVGGQVFSLSWLPPPPGHNKRDYSAPFGGAITRIPRSEWSGMLKEQKARRRRTSDHQKWECDNQGSFPTCWAAGTCQTLSTARVLRLGIQEYVRFSAMSIAVPISGGRRGGFEGEAVEYMIRHGAVDSELWPYTDPSNHDNDPKVQANRKLHLLNEAHECESFDDYATACLLNYPCTVAYNWWRHVVMVCDLVEIEPGSFGLRIRNNWGEGYGDKHDTHGFGGYAIFREGRGTPSSGYAIRVASHSVNKVESSADPYSLVV